MAFLDQLSQTATRVGKEVAEKAKNLTDIAKMKMELKSKEDFIERQYIEIGKKVFEAEKDAASSEYKEVVVIKQTFEEIETLKQEILAAKGMAKCEACGADIDPSVKFCPSCGAEVVSEEPETVDEQLEDVLEEDDFSEE